MIVGCADHACGQWVGRDIDSWAGEWIDCQACAPGAAIGIRSGDGSRAGGGRVTRDRPCGGIDGKTRRQAGGCPSIGGCTTAGGGASCVSRADGAAGQRVRRDGDRGAGAARGDGGRILRQRASGVHIECRGQGVGRVIRLEFYPHEGVGCGRSSAANSDGGHGV